VLPNSQDPPTDSPQRAIYDQSPILIGRDFLPPENAIAFGFTITARTTVPEASVNKYRQLRFPKNKIRFSMKPIMPPPAGDARISQQAHESKFRGRVTVRPDSRHQG
jgi:hypothetical protein